MRESQLWNFCGVDDQWKRSQWGMEKDKQRKCASCESWDLWSERNSGGFWRVYFQHSLAQRVGRQDTTLLPTANKSHSTYFLDLSPPLPCNPDEIMRAANEVRSRWVENANGLPNALKRRKSLLFKWKLKDCFISWTLNILHFWKKTVLWLKMTVQYSNTWVWEEE